MSHTMIPLVSLATALLTALPAYADWSKQQVEVEGFNLPYQLFEPENVVGKIPLVIHLHGSGEAGVDNEKQMYSGQNIGPDYFASDDIQAIQAAYVLAPQTPGPMRWANTSLAPYDFSSTPSTPSMTTLLALIDNMVKENSHIDTGRIYMTGLSRGGQGVWNAAFQRPELFAAIVPIAGSASPKDAVTIKDIPTWAFHGSCDPVTKPKYTKDMVDAMIRAGGSTQWIRYTEIECGGHDSSWLTAFSNANLYQWMLKQHQ